MPRLIFTYLGEEHTVEVGDSCSIGREPTNDISLAKEQGASRRHCQIMKLSTTYELTDVGSTNGTKVNNKTVKRHRLKHGDRIMIGETVLEWKERDDDEIDLEEEIDLEDPGAGGGGGAKTSAGCYLVFAGGDRDGERVALDKPRVTFGRKSSCTVQLDSSMVSGYHCEIAREGGAYVLRDLGSTNGTLLDGEPVTETAVQHGGRIRVGDVRLVFVDPTVSDFEKAMAQVDDLGTEWGMLRAEMDMSRVQKARRSQIVAVVGVLALVAAAGYVFIANPELLSDKGPQIAEVEGNLVKDFSFEQGAAVWSALPDSPTSGRTEEGEGAQGGSFYSVSRDGPAGVAAGVQLSGDGAVIAVSPGRAYEFGASVRTAGGGAAAVRIVWTGAGDGVATSYSSTALTSSSAWKEVRGVTMSPPDARGARVQLLNAGPGAAHFDDVVLRPAPSKPKTTTATDGALSVSATADGQITIARDGEALLAGAAVVGGILDPKSESGPWPERLGTASVSSVSSADGGVTVKGKVLDPYGGELGDFEVTVALSDGRHANLSGTLPAGAGLMGVVPEGFTEKGIGIWTPSGSLRESGTRFVRAASGISIGSIQLYEIRGAGDAQFPFALLQDAGGHAAVLGAGEGGLGIVVDTDSQAIKAGVDKTRQDAADAQASGRYGDAISKYGEYAGKIPEGDPRRVDAQESVTRLQEAGEARLAAVQSNAAGALAYKEIEGLDAAAAEAAKLAEEYAGYAPVASAAVQAVDELRKAVAQRRKALMEAEAAPLLLKAADFVASGKPVLAAAVYEDIKIRFPRTDAAVAAAKALGR